ncbi:hypothetical protein SFRURICE_015454, partial [Spodoptera frugiperda]
QLFRVFYKEHAQVIENKSLDTNTNRTKAWEQVHNNVAKRKINLNNVMSAHLVEQLRRPPKGVLRRPGGRPRLASPRPPSPRTSLITSLISSLHSSPRLNTGTYLSSCFIRPFKLINYLSLIKSSAQISGLQRLDLQERFNKFDSLHSQFDELQTEIELLADDAETAFVEREDFDRQFFNLVALTRSLLGSSVNGAANLKRPTQHWDDIIIFVMVKKLDLITSREWEEYRNNNIEGYPTITQFCSFLNRKADWLESVECN